MGFVNGFAARISGRVSGMGPATNWRITETLDIPVRMRDGVDLLTDLYQPKGATGLPVLLIRTPYGRRQVGGLVERGFSQRGYQVVSQSCRGTFGSGGEYLPFQSDTEDGVDTLEWLETQPWYASQVVMFGLSYPGVSQWALVADAPEGMLSGLVIQNAASRVYDVFRPGGAVGFSTALNWAYLQTFLQDGSSPIKLARALRKRKKRVARGFAHLPITESDTTATGRPFDFFQQLLRNPAPTDPLWKSTDHSNTAHTVDTPIHLIGGWYDFFLDPQLNDYARLVRGGHRPHLTIGAWPHRPNFEGYRLGYGEAITWFKATTGADRSPPRSKPVRIQIIGNKDWRDFDEWPPPPSESRHLFIRSPGQLSLSPASEVEPPTTYIYDPADPTPAAGGAVLYGDKNRVGQVDNRALERRPDVITFTTDPLPDALYVIGVPLVRLFARTTAVTTDFFVRVCDVTPRGKSLNVADGFVRFPICDHDLVGDGTFVIEVHLSATACHFEKDHRIRLQVSSGAHPRVARNLGIEDLEAGLTDVQKASQQILHDLDHPSELVLPVFAVQSN